MLLKKATINPTPMFSKTSTSICPPAKRRIVSTSSECYVEGAFHHRTSSASLTLQFALSSITVALFGTTACQNTYWKISKWSRKGLYVKVKIKEQAQLSWFVRGLRSRRFPVRYVCFDFLLICMCSFSFEYP